MSDVTVLVLVVVLLLVAVVVMVLVFTLLLLFVATDVLLIVLLLVLLLVFVLVTVLVVVLVMLESSASRRLLTDINATPMIAYSRRFLITTISYCGFYLKLLGIPPLAAKST